MCEPVWVKCQKRVLGNRGQQQLREALLALTGPRVGGGRQSLDSRWTLLGQQAGWRGAGPGTSRVAELRRVPGHGEGLSIATPDSAGVSRNWDGRGSQPGLGTLGNSSPWCQVGSSRGLGGHPGHMCSQGRTAGGFGLWRQEAPKTVRHSHPAQRVTQNKTSSKPENKDKEGQ